MLYKALRIVQSNRLIAFYKKILREVIEISTVSGAVGAYYAVKNMNASITAHAALQKISQEAMAQQMNDLLKTMPQLKSSNLGRSIDVRV